MLINRSSLAAYKLITKCKIDEKTFIVRNRKKYETSPFKNEIFLGFSRNLS